MTSENKLIHYSFCNTHKVKKLITFDALIQLTEDRSNKKLKIHTGLYECMEQAARDSS